MCAFQPKGVPVVLVISASIRASSCRLKRAKGTFARLIKGTKVEAKSAAVWATCAHSWRKRARMAAFRRALDWRALAGIVEGASSPIVIWCQTWPLLALRSGVQLAVVKAGSLLRLAYRFPALWGRRGMA